MFKNIHVTIPEPYPDNYRYKRTFSSTDIGGKVYINIIGDKPPSMKRPRLSKEEQKKEDDIKARLQKSNDNWND